jgi:hypothetical protein
MSLQSFVGHFTHPVKGKIIKAIVDQPGICPGDIEMLIDFNGDFYRYLRILVKAGIITKESDGRHRKCFVVKTKIDLYNQILKIYENANN